MKDVDFCSSVQFRLGALLLLMQQKTQPNCFQVNSVISKSYSDSEFCLLSSNGSICVGQRLCRERGFGHLFILSTGCCHWLHGWWGHGPPSSSAMPLPALPGISVSTPSRAWMFVFAEVSTGGWVCRPLLCKLPPSSLRQWLHTA